MKLIVFDVDGTLLDDQQALSRKTAAVIAALQEKGLLISLATGKILPSVQAVIKILNLENPLVLSNGALIQNPDGEFFYEKYIHPDLLILILEAAKRHEADLALFTPEHIFVLKETFNTDHIKCIFREKITVVGDWSKVRNYYPKVCKAIFINRSSQKSIDGIEKYFSSETGLACTLSTGAPNAIEILPPGVSKEDGLVQLSQCLKVPMDQIMAFGDQANDLGMVKRAGAGIAVGNAIDELKNVADYVIGTNNDQGPADFLKDYFSDLLM